MSDDLPLATFEHQVGGWHKGAKSHVLKDGKGRILKPLKLNANPTFDPDVKLTNRRGSSEDELIPFCRDEREFYERIASSTHPDDLKLQPFMPSFHGVCHVSGTDGHEVPHLILGDLTWGLQLPCVMDIKMGRTCFYPGKDHYKNSCKYVSQQELGFCLTGMQILHEDTGSPEVEMYPSDCKKLTTSQMFQGMETFCNGNNSVGSCFRHAIVTQLHEIHRWFLAQRRYKFRGSSILVVYDADQLSSVPSDIVNGKDVVAEESWPIVKVKMIDFAHVLHSFGEKDENYMLGLENLIQYFSNKE